jgi:MFS family permease
MSEVWGRKWIYIASAILFTVFQIPQALAPNIQTMLVARFISGIGGSSAIALGELFRAQTPENLH